MAMLIHATLLPAPDLYKTGQFFPVSQLFHKVKVIHGGQCGCVRLTYRAKQSKNNLKLPLVVSICPYLSRYFLQVQTSCFFTLDNNCTHHMCTSPTEY